MGSNFGGGGSIVADWAELVRLGEFDADYLQADIEPEERIRIAAPFA